MSDENATVAIRKRIAQDFCRNVLWIDDQILPKDTGIGGNEYREFFIPISEQLQERGILVNLLPFAAPNVGDTPDDPLSDDDFPSMETAKKLVERADVILLDWHLADEDSPKYSKSLLSHIAESKSTQLVLILTRKDNDFLSELMTEGLLGADKIFQEVNGGGAVILTSKTGTHITLVSKNHIAKNIADDGSEEEGIRQADEQAAHEIQESIFRLINTTYPDYLHWAALEIAAEIRNHYPKWLYSLPHGTDIAVLQELLDSKTEIRQALPENLMEDLIETAKLKNLSSLDSINTQRLHWENRPTTFQIADEPQDSVALKVINLQELEIDLQGTLSSFEDEEKTKTVFEEIKCHSNDEASGQHLSASEWLRSHFSYCEYVELISIETHSNEPTQGALYKSSSGSIFLCASQPCDCAHNNNVLLIKASKSEKTKKSSTSMRYQGDDYRFDGITEKLQQEAVSVNGDGHRILNGFTKVGQLRPAIAARIISRYWSALTRPAVNHPTFVRKLRETE